MLELIVGNGCSLLATVTDTVSSTRKTAKGVLLSQTASQVFYCVGAIVLGGYTAAVQNGVSIVRNLLAISGKSYKWIEWLLVILGVVLGIVFNTLGLMGWLPIIAGTEYSLAVFRFKNDERKLKWAFALCIGLYTIFNFAIQNYVGAASNLFVCIATVGLLLKKK